jgi:Domain of unknown function (DUF4350)
MKRHLPVFVAVLGVIGFAIGITNLFLLRFEAGDVYPPYSSLRADPLGTMVFCESLEELPGLTVRRDFSDSNKLPGEKNTTYLHLGAEESDWQRMPVDLFKEIESFVTQGGRLAITMTPVTRPPRFFTPPITTTNSPGTNAPGTKGGKTPKKSDAKKMLNDEDERVLTTSIAERWGLNFGHLALEHGDDTVYQSVRVTNVSSLPLPATLDWHSGVILTNLDESWHAIYARGTNPVVVERQFGHGTVVLATDSFFLSNEAMWQARHPEWLAWFIGPAERVVFDEAHLGVVETSAVAVLLRRYRLFGVVGALVVLAGLFIWKNALSLVPPYSMAAHQSFVTGKDAAGGFVNLLRRNIPPAKILDVCFEEWTKSLTHAGSHTIASVDRASEIMEMENTRSTRQRDPVHAYQQIASALKSHTNRTQSPEFKLEAKS